jgi:hypothetical protein
MESYGSGTVVVKTFDNSKPHLYVYYAGNIRPKLITDDESQTKRYIMARQLASYLNGDSPLPEWIEALKYTRSTPRQIINCLDGTISAVGPNVLPPNDNGRLAWRQDENEEAEADRVRLMDALGVTKLHFEEV